MSIQKETDVLVIGAGPSGTIAAAILKQHGLSVQVVEKTKFPRFVIGESLLPRCMEALEEAKLLDAVKAKGYQQKDGARFMKDGKNCDFNFSQQFTPGWKWTWQVPRADFDKTLADACEEQGVNIVYEATVTDIDLQGDHSITTVTTSEGDAKVKAKYIVDASGYGRVIPRMFGLEREAKLPPKKALFCHITDPKRSDIYDPNRIIAIVHKPGTWIWVIPFSNGNTSVGFVGDPEFFDEYAGTPEEQLKALIKSEPTIAERFADSEFAWEPRSLQSWSVTTDSFYGDGYVLTGNVTEFLDPIFSSGVTLAAVSAQLAAHLVIKQLKGEKVNWQEEYMDKMMEGINVFRTYVDCWYDGTLFDVFFAPNPREDIMGQICSVLAGYVWDEDNPFVKNHDKNIRGLAKYLAAVNKNEE